MVKHLTLKDKGIAVFPKAGNFAQLAISTILNEFQIRCVSEPVKFCLGK